MRFLWLIFLPAALYQCLALFAALRQLLRSAPAPSLLPVSVLKPLRGLDPNTPAAFASQVEQNHPQFEVLFAASDENDPALRAAAALDNPHVRLIAAGAIETPNAKAGLCAALSAQARYPLRVLNDSDIKVDPNYLSTVIAPLSDPSVGVVTCLYRVKAHNIPAAWEAFGIMTDFMPSTMVAQAIGVREFGLGSTLAFRAADLAAAGGFEAIGAYIADDYQLAKRISQQGKRVVLSTYVVETALGEATWAGAWLHQLRWARTIRLSKGAGYAGLPITHCGVWAVLALALGYVPLAATLCLLRMSVAFVGGGLVLDSSLARALAWLAPGWDLYSFSVWVASYFGRTVRWRDRVLTLDAEGRILRRQSC